jgi:hypothetical protein
MSTRSRPSSGRVRATSGQAVSAIEPTGAGTARITDLIRSMKAEIEEFIAEHIG